MLKQADHIRPSQSFSTLTTQLLVNIQVALVGVRFRPQIVQLILGAGVAIRKKVNVISVSAIHPGCHYQ